MSASSAARHFNPTAPMKSVPRMFLITLAITGWAVAAKPARPGLTKYSSLWSNSPFTSKPLPPPPGEEADPLEDYALLGVSPIGGGYRVTLIHKKKPEERVTVDSDRPSGDFKIISVVRKPGDPLGTVVRMTSGSRTGTVGFDEKLLVLAPPPAPKPQPGANPAQPGQPGAQPQLQPGQMPPRQPRPRVVPPPVPTPPAAQPTQSTERPDRRGGR